MRALPVVLVPIALAILAACEEESPRDPGDPCTELFTTPIELVDEALLGAGSNWTSYSVAGIYLRGDGYVCSVSCTSADSDGEDTGDGEMGLTFVGSTPDPGEGVGYDEWAPTTEGTAGYGSVAEGTDEVMAYSLGIVESGESVVCTAQTSAGEQEVIVRVD